MFTQRELSERLANAGILPMFGFPTRVRELYYPEGAWPAAPGGVAAGRSSQAVSLFSPGSLVINDGWVYEANGFADYRFDGRSDNPLKSKVAVRRCTSCSYADSDDGSGDVTSCPVCKGGRAHVHHVSTLWASGRRQSAPTAGRRSTSRPARPGPCWAGSRPRSTRCTPVRWTCG